MPICYKHLGILQRVTKNQKIHLSKHDGFQNFITSTFNHVYNILNVFDGSANFPFTTSERKCNNCMFELPLKLPNDLRLRILGNQEMSQKSQNFIDLVQSPSPEMKILSVLIKISRKTEVEFFSQCAISFENLSLSQLFSE